jgi:cation transport ATPase
MKRRHDAAHVNLRMERWHRQALYATALLLVASGIAWLGAHFFLRRATEFGASIHPLEPWSMKLHGAAAMAMLFFVGSVMNSHVRRALRAQRNLAPGWSLLAALAALTVSGYGLWYLAGEENRVLWSTLHWVIGLAFPLLLVGHIAYGRRLRHEHRA